MVHGDNSSGKRSRQQVKLIVGHYLLFLVNSSLLKMEISVLSWCNHIFLNRLLEQPIVGGLGFCICQIRK
jgi:hypothetical protein